MLPTNPGLYFGPYRITQVVSGSHVTLEPNPTWYGEAPQFKRVVIRIIENTAALEANLLSGEVDYVAGELGFNIEQALSFERRNPDRFTYLYKPGLIYEHLDVNLDNPMLADVRVRQALLYALDRDIRSGSFDPGGSVLFIHTGGVFSLFSSRSRIVAAVDRWTDVSDA